jgi:pSer/pThr/pTyr-binding forkhead associated (FHA) protein
MEAAAPAGGVAPRFIVEVCFGPNARRRAVIEAGRTLRVGRTELADMVLPGDEQLSRVHFELAWDGARCALRDLGSARGTLVDGEPVTAAEVPHGAWIRAGETDFAVYVEQRTPPPIDAPEPAPKPMRDAAIAELSAEAEKGTLFAVLDCARDPRIGMLLRESADEVHPLYQGITAETMAEVAPYLVRFEAGSRLLARLVGEGWGRAWGVYLVSRSTARELRAHLRRHVFVTDEERDAPMYFRFYDPRVLPLFLPTCSVRQEDELFGAIDAFLCEDEAGRILRLGRRR